MTINVLSPGAITVLTLAAAIGITVIVLMARADRQAPLRTCPWCTDLWSPSPSLCNCTEPCGTSECEAAVPACRLCDTGAGPCDCIGPCGRRRCQAAEVGDDTLKMLGDAMFSYGRQMEQWLKEGDGRD